MGVAMHALYPATRTPGWRGDSHPSIVIPQLLRIAMHFGASYIRDADNDGPFAHHQSHSESDISVHGFRTA
jgi:hypothetical protein